MRLFIYLLLSITIFILPHALLARWASFEDAEIERHSDVEILVNADGTYEETVSVKIKILKERARLNYSHYQLHYNSSTSKLSIIEAKAVNLTQDENKKKEYKVPKELLEDKAIARDNYGFDSIRVRSIAFPNLNVGSEIILKYKIKVFKTIFKGFWSDVLRFGQTGYELHNKVKIASMIPVFLHANDPDNVLDVKNSGIKNTKGKNRNKQIIEVSIKRPYIKMPIDEPSNSVVGYTQSAVVFLSTLDKGEALSKKFAKEYNKVIKQELPELYSKILEKAVAEKDEVAQINKVTELLNEMVHFMADMRSINGRLIPRDLKYTASHGMGDCKDFSVGTGAILRNMGYDVHFLLVYRGYKRASGDPHPLPVMMEFNHVMLKVTGKSGKVYYIDSTNHASMADGIFPDIASRYAMLIDTEHGGYVYIPDIDPHHARAEKNEQVSIKEVINQDQEKDQENVTNGVVIPNLIMNRSGTIKMSGELASDFTGMELYISKKMLSDNLYQWISHVELDEKEKKGLTVTPLKSRIVKPIEIKYAYEYDNDAFLTNDGYGIKLNSSWHREILSSKLDQVGDLFLGIPREREYIVVVNDVIAKNPQLIDFDVKSKWLTAKREYKQNGKNLEIHESVKILKPYVNQAEIATSDFQQMKKNVERFFARSFVVLKKA